jgi:hypothetical protein
MPRERVLCAAIWVDDGQEHPHLPRNLKTGVVFAGWRHHNCFTALNLVFPRPTGPVDEEQLAGKHQGFLTTWGRFVDRDEAGRIAFEAGQVDRDDLHLTSEHLY